MAHDFHLQLRPGVRLQPDGADLLLARADGQALRQRAPGGGLRTLLQTLSEAGGRADDLIALAQEAEPTAPAVSLYYLLASLERRCWLSYTLVQDGQTLATLEPMTQAFRLVAVDDAAPGYRLSRFAWTRRDGEATLVECSLGPARLRLRDGRLAAALGLLTRPQTAATLAAARPDLTPATVTGLLALLASIPAVFACDAAGSLPEDRDPALRQWEYHDLLFHSRSRMGRHDYPLGGTFRFLGQLPHAPALKAPAGGPRFPLPRPDPAAPGPDFFAVVEARRSVRRYGDTPLSLEQLGTLLWHSARVQSHRPADPNDARQYETTLRPVAGGGAMHELELYLTVTRCTGLEPALYRYDPLVHELEWIAAPSADTQALLNGAMAAAALEVPPDVLITLAARFGRMAWKYEGMAYAVTLKHVGVLYQQFYLVATALGLAPCALGAGDSDRFAAAAGTHYYEETSVGEFALAGTPG
ncbi:SagB family peptide dehydrogenase [uncultured Lamprocystis sp.]|jgi:SagB-type dehydrogenase family enzyme|uniref:SagB family peptide dehydrogenase n=1 Tax=uncultured Lamprocystis sp. TaxID=543132 RepID=UPI0025F1360E|nr:SagB family peptide dehydrogenase [uncultured Lamprocystis sp.]